MRYFFAVVAFLVSASVMACDKAAAQVVMENLRGLARITDGGGHQRYEWGSFLDNQSDDRRMRFVRSAADADACLSGRAREMRHFISGRYFAIASPTTGIRLIN